MKAQEAREKLARLEANIEHVIRGKNDVVRMAMIGLLAHGHMLLEDVPGVGKTTLAHCLALSLGLSFQRIQFTSDLLPSDILGVMVFDQRTGEFVFREGPIFAHIILADEINRATPKTQSALLEAMSAATVTIEKSTHPLAKPFFVIATQNPTESHGAFPLPNSQLDRFLMRLRVGYPEPEFEREILRNRFDQDLSKIESILSREDILAMQAGTADVRMDESLIDYIVRLAHATRRRPEIELGVSTRGALALRRCAQAKAYLEGRDFCVADDVKSLAEPVLAHRITPTRGYDGGPDGMGEGVPQIRAIMEEIEAPI